MKDYVKSILDELQTASLWQTVFLLSSGLVGLFPSPTLQIVGVSIPTVKATAPLFGFSIVIMLHLLRLCVLLRDMLALAETDSETILLVNNHPWPLNPFSQSITEKHKLLDSVGVAGLVALYWLGILAPVHLLQGSKVEGSQLIFILFFVYLVLAFTIFRTIASSMPYCISETSRRFRTGIGVAILLCGTLFTFH